MPRGASRTPLRLVTQTFPDDPVFDTAVSRALLERVAAGELPETLRLGRPGPMVAFAKRDAVSPGYAEAARAARGRGFEAVLRQAGGRAAVFHEGTIALAHAVPGDDPRAGIHARFEETASAAVSALSRLGVDARVGKVPGEWCPGGYSVNAGGQVKLVGIGQRVVAGGAHVGAVVVAERGDRVADPLKPVYQALGLEWDPGTAGSVADAAPGTSWERVAAALRDEYAARSELEPWSLDEETLALARRLAPDHRAPD